MAHLRSLVNPAFLACPRRCAVFSVYLPKELFADTKVILESLTNLSSYRPPCDPLGSRWRKMMFPSSLERVQESFPPKKAILCIGMICGCRFLILRLILFNDLTPDESPLMIHQCSSLSKPDHRVWFKSTKLNPRKTFSLTLKCLNLSWCH